ncbi:DUF2059 domain-containing protein [Stutzerimonas kirkiae]|uniref:DUF2059 domain-containing protein n=1 Tax=Stutzerimonas kirkiae TaxID=2211392 RepID=UPI00103830DA|nr:DUF2059 domain-containing protein [Stutzerimonas kirkiae]TBV17353.1 hypothetical protein DNK01_00325 [Stutzerimonas kirkiae]
MPSFRYLVLAGALALGGQVAPALADQAAHVRNAEEFLRLARAQQLATPVYAQVQDMFAQRFAQLQGGQKQQALLDSYQARANAALDKAIGWDKLKPELVKLYTGQFTEQELRQLIDFYQSPLGRKVLTQLPELNMRSAQITQSKLEAAVPEVNRLLDDMSKALEAKKE